MEGGRRLERPVESPEVARVRLEDARIRAALGSPESNRALFEESPVLWIKGSIGFDTERGKSEVSDRELMVRLVEYGRYEWDPLIVRSVVTYLHSLGFSWAY
jgi:hypothetical protein